MTAPRRPRHGTWALALLSITLAACGSGPGSTSSSTSTSAASVSGAQLKVDDAAVLANMKAYLSKSAACKGQSSPVVCLEAADRTLGGQIHDYANTLAAGTGFEAKSADVTAARNAAQLLANSMEILGDAQPSQANYDQVLNTFNVTNAVASLQKAVAKVQNDLG